MKTAAVLSTVFFGISALCAPMPTQSHSFSNATVTTTSSGPSKSQTLLPSLQVQWREDQPSEMGRNTPYGELSRKDGKHSVHTAAYFVIPSDAAGKTCKLAFHVDSTGNSQILYPGTFDLYRLNGVLNEGYSFGNKVTRGAHVGTLKARYSQDAEWVSKSDLSADTMTPHIESATAFTCTPGEFSFEMIPKGDSAAIKWKTTPSNANGLSIEIC